jgi:hypothetical protein
MRLFALDTVLRLRPGATHEELSSVMEGHVLERAELMGTYRKKAEQAAQVRFEVGRLLAQQLDGAKSLDQPSLTAVEWAEAAVYQH